LKKLLRYLHGIINFKGNPNLRDSKLTSNRKIDTSISA
jgi:hypothetical protein